MLDRIASGGVAQPDQVLVLDSVRAVFPRDPFLTKTIGLSVFCEGPTRIGESDYNRDRLGLFVPLDERLAAATRRVVDGAARAVAASA